MWPSPDGQMRYPDVQGVLDDFDGLFGAVAFAVGIEKGVLRSQIFRLEHESSSGWTPEGEEKPR